jgi:transcriptional regulator with XRE-family HTH domain
MKGSSYRDRDYAFGKAMLVLRTRIGLTQIELAGLLGISRRAVSDWEAGKSYPKLVHLKQFVALAFEHRAFPAQSEADELRTFWQASHQKVPLEKAWSDGLPYTKPLRATQVETGPCHPGLLWSQVGIGTADRLDSG